MKRAGQRRYGKTVSTIMYEELCAELDKIQGDDKRNRSKIIRSLVRFLVGRLNLKGPIQGEVYFLDCKPEDVQWITTLLRRLNYDIEPET